MKAKDITPGLVINKIRVIKKTEKPQFLKQRGSYWVYQCICGKYVVTHATTLVRGIYSCGCISHPKKYKTKKTIYYRRLYHVWHTIKDRCLRQGSHDYDRYGGRGIKINVEWLDFGNFYNDMIDNYKPGLSIERLDVNGNYCKDNCTWATNDEQAKNRRSSLAYRNKTGYQWKYAKKMSR